MFRTVLFICLLITCYSQAQFLPREASELNYRIVGFKFPDMSQVSTYRVAIADGNYYSEDSFRRNEVRTVSSKTNRIIAEVPRFGRSYTWRAVYQYANGEEIKGPFHHFTTGVNDFVDTGLTRLRLLKQNPKYKDDFFVLDGARAIYDYKGMPVWFLPGFDESSTPVDLKLSPAGTITFLYNDDAYEVNYNGDILWKGPNNGKVNGDTAEVYHHEFTRLSNGHYMVLGTDYEYWNPETGTADTSGTKADSTGLNHKYVFGTLIEYDQKGNIVWSWKTFNYFQSSYLVNYHPPMSVKLLLHENSFYFDEAGQVIYLSCKDIGHILKIRYPEGTMINSYGEKYLQGVTPEGNGMFCDQHSIRHSPNGYLYVYNNNPCKMGSDLPTIELLRELPEAGVLKKIWEYKCTTEGLDTTKLNRVRLMNARGKLLLKGQTSGGNVLELPDSSLFVSMNGRYAKMFIVNRNKKVLWCALPERKEPEGKVWNAFPQYRASITNRDALENLIWKSEKD